MKFLIRASVPVWGLVLTAMIAIALGQDAKIGFVDSTQVLYETEEGKQGLEELNRFRSEKQAEFETRNAELQQLQSEYTAQQRTLNSVARAERERLIEEKQVALQRFQEDAQSGFNDRQNQLLQRISEKVQKIIDEFAQQHGFSAIFMRDQRQAYVAPSLDVTQQVISLYNQQHPGSGTGDTGTSGQGAVPPSNQQGN